MVDEWYVGATASITLRGRLLYTRTQTRASSDIEENWYFQKMKSGIDTLFYQETVTNFTVNGRRAKI